MTKSGPNILITGTPATGKSTLCQVIEERTGMEWLNIGKIAEENNCFDGFDSERNCPILDEDKVLDEMEDLMQGGGKIVDYHSCDFFPERFFDIVFVLRTNNTILYDRFQARGYSGKKLEDNLECEIMNVIIDEAKDSYREEIVHELKSDTPEEMEDNVERIAMWIDMWRTNNQ